MAPRSGASAAVEQLRQGFEALGLSPYAARVLVALLSVGSGNSAELARLSEVPRTSLYPVLEELVAQRLAERLGGDGPAVWASPGRDAVMDQLDAAEEERLLVHRVRTARVRTQLDDLLDTAPSQTAPSQPADR